MNCPSRPDPIPLDQDGYNQSPHPLALESNNDRNGLANRILQRDHRLRTDDNDMLEDRIGPVLDQQPNKSAQSNSKAIPSVDGSIRSTAPSEHEEASPPQSQRTGPLNFITTNFHNLRRILVKFTKFVGPGLMISVAYIDPGNYATDVAAGANYKYQLLVMVLVSNIIAIFLQSLCIKLGSVTGMDLAQNVKAHCPWWLNIILYLFAEAAIIATDMAEVSGEAWGVVVLHLLTELQVIGTAIALNLLLNIPIVAGCAISIVDVIIILLFYRPSGSMRGVRLFEIFVSLLVLAVVICFCIELSLISVPNVGELFRGFLPSGALVQREGFVFHSHLPQHPLIPPQSLSSLRHPRRHSNAPQPLSRQRHRPTPPLQLRPPSRQRFRAHPLHLLNNLPHLHNLRRLPRRLHRTNQHHRPEIQASTLQTLPRSNPLLSLLLHRRARHLSIHRRPLRQLRHPHRCRRLPLQLAKRSLRLPLRHPRPALLHARPRRRHGLRARAPAVWHVCWYRVYHRRADGE